ncbi:MAG: Hydrogenase isoenzymes nickel incorporation protein HypB [Firmicutes bacterium]|nr:Hydrogenase isoenzymes nickel incorporation protein HypB [Bacillota bacterium]
MNKAEVKVRLARDLRAKNKLAAAELRTLFALHNVFVVNLQSSPGAGKTTLLEASLPLFCSTFRVGVIEGDLYTARDAERLLPHVSTVVQINTEGGCHLDASLIGGALNDLSLAELDLLIIENVGNLVCPAGFDLGEDVRVVLLSVTEGDDKPEKYPQMFREADMILLNKVDLLPYVRFDLSAVREELRQLNPLAPIMDVVATQGQLGGWVEWVKRMMTGKQRGESHGYQSHGARQSG